MAKIATYIGSLITNQLPALPSESNKPSSSSSEAKVWIRL